jgi:hypothetical protein
VAQGKAFDKTEIMKVLEPLFKLGYSINKACEYAGIEQSTVAKWLSADEILSKKVKVWQNEVNTRARANWIKAIDEGIETKNGRDYYTPSKDWLERREKQDFSTRQELTGEEGTAIEQLVIHKYEPNNK